MKFRWRVAVFVEGVVHRYGNEALKRGFYRSSAGSMLKVIGDHRRSRR